MIIAQVATIKAHSKRCSFTVFSGGVRKPKKTSTERTHTFRECAASLNPFTEIVFVRLVSSACSNLWLIGRKTKGSCVYAPLYTVTNWFFVPDATFPVPQPHLQFHSNTPSSCWFVCSCVRCTLDMRPSSCL